MALWLQESLSYVIYTLNCNARYIVLTLHTIPDWLWEILEARTIQTPFTEILVYLMHIGNSLTSSNNFNILKKLKTHKSRILDNLRVSSQA